MSNIIFTCDVYNEISIDREFFVVMINNNFQQHYLIRDKVKKI